MCNVIIFNTIFTVVSIIILFFGSVLYTKADYGSKILHTADTILAIGLCYCFLLLLVDVWCWIINLL